MADGETRLTAKQKCGVAWDRVNVTAAAAAIATLAEIKGDGVVTAAPTCDPGRGQLTEFDLP